MAAFITLKCGNRTILDEVVTTQFTVDQRGNYLTDLFGLRLTTVESLDIHVRCVMTNRDLQNISQSMERFERVDLHPMFGTYNNGMSRGAVYRNGFMTYLQFESQIGHAPNGEPMFVGEITFRYSGSMPAPETIELANVDWQSSGF